MPTRNVISKWLIYQEHILVKKRLFGGHYTQLENSQVGGNNGAISIAEVYVVRHTGLSSLYVLI